MTYLTNLNSTYLRPTGVSFTDWNYGTTTSWQNVDEEVYYPNDNIDGNYIRVHYTDDDDAQLILLTEKPSTLISPQNVTAVVGYKLLIPYDTPAVQDNSGILRFDFSLDGSNYIEEKSWKYFQAKSGTAEGYTELRWVTFTWPLDSGVSYYTNPSLKIISEEHSSFTLFHSNGVVQLHAIYLEVDNANVFPMFVQAPTNLTAISGISLYTEGTSDIETILRPTGISNEYWSTNPSYTAINENILYADTGVDSYSIWLNCRYDIPGSSVLDINYDTPYFVGSTNVVSAYLAHQTRIPAGFGSANSGLISVELAIDGSSFLDPQYLSFYQEGVGGASVKSDLEWTTFNWVVNKPYTDFTNPTLRVALVDRLGEEIFNNGRFYIGATYLEVRDDGFIPFYTYGTGVVPDGFNIPLYVLNTDVSPLLPPSGTLSNYREIIVYPTGYDENLPSSQSFDLSRLHDDTPYPGGDFSSNNGLNVYDNWVSRGPNVITLNFPVPEEYRITSSLGGLNIFRPKNMSLYMYVTHKAHYFNQLFFDLINVFPSGHLGVQCYKYQNSYLDSSGNLTSNQAYILPLTHEYKFYPGFTDLQTSVDNSYNSTDTYSEWIRFKTPYPSEAYDIRTLQEHFVVNLDLKRGSNFESAGLEIKALYLSFEFEDDFPLYIRGWDTFTDNLDIYTVGQSGNNLKTPLYTKGHENLVDNIILFTEGTPNLLSSGTTLYASGALGESLALPLYTWNFETLSSGINIYASGQYGSSKGIPIYFKGHPYDETSRELYTYGEYGATSRVPLYIHPPLPSEDVIDLYVEGVFIHSSGTPLFTKSAYLEDSGLPLYTVSENFYLISGVANYNNLYDNYDKMLDSLQSHFVSGPPAMRPAFARTDYVKASLTPTVDFFKPYVSGSTTNYWPPGLGYKSHTDQYITWTGGPELYARGDIYFNYSNRYGIRSPYYAINSGELFFAPYSPGRNINQTGYTNDGDNPVLQNILSHYLEEFFDIYDIVNFEPFLSGYFANRFPNYWAIIDSWNGTNFSNGPALPNSNLAGEPNWGNEVTFLLYENSGGVHWMPVLNTGVWPDVIASSISYVQSLTNPHHPYNMPLYMNSELLAKSGIPMTVASYNPIYEGNAISYNKLYDNYELLIPYTKNRASQGFWGNAPDGGQIYNSQRALYSYINYSNYQFDGTNLLYGNAMLEFFKPNPNNAVSSDSGVSYFLPSLVPGLTPEGVGIPTFNEIYGYIGPLYVSGHLNGTYLGNEFSYLMPFGGFPPYNPKLYFTPYFPPIGEEMLSISTTGLQHNLLYYLNQYFDPYSIADFKTYLESYYQTHHSDYWDIIQSWDGGRFADLPNYPGSGTTNYSNDIAFVRCQNGLGYYWVPTLKLDYWLPMISSVGQYVAGLTNPHHPYVAPLYVAGLFYSHTSGIPLYTKTSQNGLGNVKDSEDGVPLYLPGLGIRGSSNFGLDLYTFGYSSGVGRGMTLYVNNSPHTIENSIGLVTYNATYSVYSGVPLYITNMREGVSIFDPEYFTLQDGGRPYSQGMNLYMANHLVETPIPLFVKVLSEMSGSVPAYIAGANQDSSGIPLYMTADGSLVSSLKLYSHGF